jgi:predicted transcriptional regulator
MNATTQKLDAQILGYLSHLSNRKKKAVLTVVKTFAEDDDAEYWNEMTSEIKESISIGLQQANGGLGKPHAEVMKKYKKWIGK